MNREKITGFRESFYDSIWFIVHWGDFKKFIHKTLSTFFPQQKYKFARVISIH